MPKISGIFDQFKDIDLIPIPDILSWLGRSPNTYFVENYIANLLFYPQTIPTTIEELEIELAVLREVLKKAPQFFDTSKKKINISEDFMARFPDLKKLAWAFIDGYKPQGITELVLVKKGYNMVLGSVIAPDFQKPDGLADIIFPKKPNPSAQRIYNLKQGTILELPCLLPKIQMEFKSADAILLNQKELAVEIAGGEIGIIFDGRGKK